MNRKPALSEREAGAAHFGEAGWKNRLNAIGRKTLHVLEKILDLSKMAFKKTEQMFSIWAAKLRARRKGKKFEEITPDNFSKEPDEASILEELEKTKRYQQI